VCQQATGALIVEVNGIWIANARSVADALSLGEHEVMLTQLGADEAGVDVHALIIIPTFPLSVLHNILTISLYT